MYAAPWSSARRAASDKRAGRAAADRGGDDVDERLAVALQLRLADAVDLEKLRPAAACALPSPPGLPLIPRRTTRIPPREALLRYADAVGTAGAGPLAVTRAPEPRSAWVRRRPRSWGCCDGGHGHRPAPRSALVCRRGPSASRAGHRAAAPASRPPRARSCPSKPSLRRSRRTATRYRTRSRSAFALARAGKLFVGVYDPKRQACDDAAAAAREQGWRAHLHLERALGRRAARGRRLHDQGPGQGGEARLQSTLPCHSGYAGP